jgi:hypothetical protein
MLIGIRPGRDETSWLTFTFAPCARLVSGVSNRALIEPFNIALDVAGLIKFATNA